MKKKILTIVLVVLAVCLFTAACDGNIWKTDFVFEHDHSQFVTKVEAKDSTCTEAGNIEFYRCTCGKAFSDITAQTEISDESEIIVPKKPHAFDRQSTAEKYFKTAATCAAKAMYYYSCVCGEKGTETFEHGELAEHSLDDNGICTVCDSVIEDTDGITYTLSSDKTYYSVTGYTGTATRVRIAESYNGLPVKAIADGAFSNNYEITEVIIPSSVASIGDSVFGLGDSGSSLDTIYYTGTLADWMQIEFTLKNYPLLYFVKDLYIDNELIRDLNLTSISKISDLAFAGYTSLTSVTIGGNVNSIGGGAFVWCSSLTSVTIGEGVTSIGEGAFYGCSSLTSVTIGEDVTSIGFGAFAECLSLTSVTIGEDVTSIGDSAFACCSLTSVTIPDGVTSIGDYAFYNCYKLVEVINKSNLTITKGSEDYGYVAYYALNVKTEGASDIVNVDDYLFYTYNSINYLLGYIGNQTALVLPDKYNDQNYEIYKYAFYDCSSLTSVTIPDGVTSIGESAFERCSKLTIVTIGSGVTSIGDYAFRYCSSLTSVTIPDNVTSIGSRAFEHCYKLVEVINKSKLNITKGSENNGRVAEYALKVKTEGTSDIVNVDGYLFYTHDGTNYLLGYIGNQTALVLPDKYNGQNYEIYQYAFYGCRSLTSVTIPDSVTSIGDWAFYYCESLTSVTIGNGVTSIGDWAFQGCVKLIVKDNGVHYVDNWVIGADSSITSAIIKAGTRGIADRAFEGCSSLRSVTIPDSVTSIGYRAFEGCYKLFEVINKSNLTITKGSEDNGYVAYYALNVKKEGASDIKNIDGCLFYTYNGTNYLLSYTGNQTALVLPDKYNGQNYEIYQYAFRGCSSLTSVTIGNGVTSIGDGAFYECSKLTSVTIGNGVTSIGGYAFWGCSSLTSVKYTGTIDQWVQINFSYYFSNPLYYAKKLYINNELVTEANITTATKISAYAFYNCMSLTCVTIPDSVTSIGSQAFEHCYKLVEVINKSKLNITKGSYYDNGFVAYYALNVKTEGTSDIVNVDGYLFYTHDGTNYLLGYIGNGTDLVLPDKYNEQNYEIYKCAFYGCSSLTSVTIGSGVNSIDFGVFGYCTSLTSVSIPDSVTSIGMYAFEGCSSLTSVTIGSGVNSIDFGAFSGCYKLVEIINKSNLTITKGSEDNGYVAYYALNVKEEGASDIVNDNGYLFYTHDDKNYLLGYTGNQTALVLPDKYNGQNYEIYQYAFRNCSSLTSVTIPDSVTSIGYMAFEGCSSLTSVTIPDSVTSIGERAFSGCSSLTSVYYKGTETGWYNMSIDSYNSYLTSATRYYYSESNPFEGESAVTGGNYWHYDTDGKTPVVWTKD